MPAPGFFDENASRAYPLVRDTEFLPSDLLVDAAFVVGTNAGYEAGKHAVYLDRARIVDAALELRFRSSAPGLLETPLLFDCPLSAEKYTTVFAGPAAGLADTTVAGFIGYLTFGDLSATIALLAAAPQQTLAGLSVLETSRVQNLCRQTVRSINVVNRARTRYRYDTECLNLCWPYGDAERFVWATGQQGALRFISGFNCRVSQDATNNSLVFDAILGAGLGEPCAELPMYPGQVPPQGSVYLTGGPSCNSSVRSINGVAAKDFNLRGGPGTRVEYFPEQHRIVITVDFHDQSFCEGVEVVDESTLGCDPWQYSEDPCDCGPR